MDVANIHNCPLKPRLLYHFLWRPMRGKPLLVGDAADRLQALLCEKAEMLGLAVCTLEIKPDCVYLAVEAPPTIAPHSIVCGLKAHSSGVLRREYKELTTVPTLWTREYLVAAGEGVRMEHLLQALYAALPPRRSPGRPRCVHEA